MGFKLIAVLIILFLSACGGGGSGDKTQSSIAEQPRSLTPLSSSQASADSNSSIETSSASYSRNSTISSLSSRSQSNSSSRSSTNSSANSSAVVVSSSAANSSVAISSNSSTSSRSSSSAMSLQSSSNAGISLVVLEETFDDMVFPDGRSSFVIGDLFMGWQSGGQLTIENDPYRTGKAIKAHYPISDSSGNVPNWMAFYTLSNYQTYEILVEFDARIPATPGGAKFFKVFGIKDSDGDVANTTFGLISDEGGSENGSLRQISFGDGTLTSSDTDQVINLNGSAPEQIGRSWGKGAQVFTGGIWKHTDWQDGWHHFETRTKFNTGNCIDGKSPVAEVNDGAYLLKIDGKVYVNATGIFNRHCKNLPIDRIDFFNHSQNTSIPFDIWIDNIKVTAVY